jgi:hypothetical protein
MLLEFQVNEAALAADREVDPRTADAGALQETYFLMPTRLQVHQDELFAVPPKALRTTYTWPGSGWRLRFQTSGQEVLIHSEVNGHQSCAHYTELLAAFEHFASTVREVLSRKVPELQEHPYWGKWLREKQDSAAG